VTEFTGIMPPLLEEGKKDRITSGVPLSWVKANFKDCPKNAAPEVIERYAKVWLWHLVGVLPDARLFWEHPLLDDGTNSEAELGRDRPL
jgi:hypothetical protein